MKSLRKLSVASVIFALTPAVSAHAQTGVSDNAVSLPDGAGSREGAGDDARVTGNMGAMSHSYSMGIPAGFPGVTPSVSLSYSSQGGNGPVGMGWSMPMDSVERRTLFGIPGYDLDDSFQAGGQLVYIEGSNPRVYRSRFENGFALHEWHDAGDGGEGYWMVRSSDGSISYYGADASGSLVSNARIGGDEGTFRYLLVERVDRYGHRLVYSYDVLGGTSLPVSAEYVFVDGAAQYEVAFTWEDRDDPIVDATGGFADSLEHRLASVTASKDGTEVASWELTYESVEASGGASRLASVQQYGVGGEAFPTADFFGYASALGEICDGSVCDQPFIRELGELGVDLQSGDPQLIDLNGDALPDIVDSSLDGSAHRIFLNVLNADGTQAFADAVSSAVGAQDGFDFSNARIQVVDIDGNGLSDAVNMLTGNYLLNAGLGDWSAETSLSGSVVLPDFEGDFSDGELQTIRFVDIDNDRRIDVLRSTGGDASNITTVYRNTGDGFEVLAGVDPIGAGFDSDTLELNDMNGDGLVDPVQVRTGGVRYRLSLGNGRWAPADGWYEAAFDTGSLADGELATADLEDLNGDGLCDLVLVSGTTVQIWVNTGGEELVALDPITSADVAGGSIPSRTSSTTVLYADMNGNGSSDVVWVTASGEVTVLDAFPTRANLLTSITNSTGMETTVSYASSVQFAAEAREAGDPWPYALPFAQTVVSGITRNDAINDVPLTETFAYHAGYYDSVEKQFRGYETVTRTLVGDASHEGSVETMTYDIGNSADGPYSAGLVLFGEMVDEEGAPLIAFENFYDDCEVAGVTGTESPQVRRICQTMVETEIMEGADESEWVLRRQEYEYDGYGRMTNTVDHGIVTVGGGACGPCDRPSGEFGAPCGATCTGDESYTEDTWIDPGEDTDGLWFLAGQRRSRSFGEADATDYAETIFYYDGQPFEGLPEGQLTLGELTRLSVRRSADTYIDAGRYWYDEHGNVIEELLPTSAVNEWEGRVLVEMSADGLRPIGMRTQLEQDGEEYYLEKTWAYDDLLDVPTLMSDWTVIAADGTPLTSTVFDSFELDAFGRVVAHRRPGATSTTRETEYVYAADHSRTTTTIRSQDGGAMDVEMHQCIDGFGRTYRIIENVEDGRYVVLQSSRFGAKGARVESFQPYEASSVDCTAAPPADVVREATTYDAFGRVLTQVTLDGSDELQRSEHAYTPTEIWLWDAMDLDPTSVSFNTPLVRQMDGLDRVVAVGRVEETDGEPAWYTANYSQLGDLVRLTDPAGNTRTQSHDLEGNVTRVDDPDRGTILYEYDANGQTVREIDDTPFVVFREYDGIGRVTAEGVEGTDALTTRVRYDFDPDCPESRCTFGAHRDVSRRFEALGMEVTSYNGFDARGNPIWNRRDFGDFALDFDITYDNIDRVVAETLPSGFSYGFEYNAQSNVTRVDGLVDAIDRRIDGRANRWEYANGAVMAWERNAVAQPTTMELFDGEGERREAFEYAYRADRSIASVTDLEPSSERPSRSAVYGYDASGRLIEAALSLDVAAFAEEVEYTYDLAENLTARTSTRASSPVNDGVRTMSSDAPHALVAVGELTLDYDEAGRVTRLGDMAYSRDGLGRIAAVDLGATMVEHGYGMGEDRAVTLGDDVTVFRVGAGFEVRDGVMSSHVVIDGVPVARIESAALAASVLPDVAPLLLSEEIEADGAINAADAWVLFATEQGWLAPAGVETERTANQVLSAAAAVGLISGGDRTSYLHTDYNENVFAVTDEDGLVAERSVYYPFGERMAAFDEVHEPLGFTGQRRDPEDDAMRIGPRAFHTGVARWLEPDAMFESLDTFSLDAPWEAMGTYQYGWNTPVNERDQNGYLRTDAQIVDGLSASQQTSLVRLVDAFVGLADVAPWRTTVDLTRSAQFESQNRVAPLRDLENAGMEINGDPTYNGDLTPGTPEYELGYQGVAAELLKAATRWGPHVRDQLTPTTQRKFDRLMRHRTETGQMLMAVARQHELIVHRNREGADMSRRSRFALNARLMAVNTRISGIRADRARRAARNRGGMFGMVFGNARNRTARSANSSPAANPRAHLTLAAISGGARPKH